jgi:hypothetical protein
MYELAVLLTNTVRTAKVVNVKRVRVSVWECAGSEAFMVSELLTSVCKSNNKY